MSRASVAYPVGCTSSASGLLVCCELEAEEVIYDGTSQTLWRNRVPHKCGSCPRSRNCSPWLFPFSSGLWKGVRRTLECERIDESSVQVLKSWHLGTLSDYRALLTLSSFLLWNSVVFEAVTLHLYFWVLCIIGTVIFFFFLALDSTWLDSPVFRNSLFFFFHNKATWQNEAYDWNIWIVLS